MRKPLPTIGVDRYTFFPITESDSTITYGTPYELKGTVEITPTDSGGSEVFDADNGAYETSVYIEKVGHEIVNADILPEVDAIWRGMPRTGSTVDVRGNTPTKYFGVAWRSLKSDGTYRYVRYYKGSYGFASNVGGKTKPSSGAPEKQTAKATYTAVQCESNGLYYSYVDEADLDSDAKEKIATSWFTDMSYYPDPQKTTYTEA